MHVRRGDLQYERAKTDVEHIYNNTKVTNNTDIESYIIIIIIIITILITKALPTLPSVLILLALLI